MDAVDANTVDRQLDTAIVRWFQDGIEMQRPLREAGGITFENCAPVRRFAAYRGQLSFPGLYYAATMDAHIGFESWLERDHAMLLDFDPQVIAFSSQPFQLTWLSPEGRRQHVPDFFARRVDGSALVVDCRPQELVDERSARAFQLTADACARLGWVYRVVGEIDEARIGNLRWLAGYRHRRYGLPEALAAAVRSAFTSPGPLIQQVSMAGDPIEVLPIAFHLLWSGVLTADLSRPFSETTLVGLNLGG